MNAKQIEKIILAKFKERLGYGTSLIIKEAAQDVAEAILAVLKNNPAISEDSHFMIVHREIQRKLVVAHFSQGLKAKGEFLQR